MSVRQSAIDLLSKWEAPDPAQDSLRHAVLSYLHARDDACGGFSPATICPSSA